MLVEYGGHIVLTKDWAKSILRRMGFVKRRGTTSKSKIGVENFCKLKEDFLQAVSSTVLMEEIPPEIILNWDQT